MTIWILMLSLVAVVIARVFGPSSQRAAITRRLRSGSLELADRTRVTVSGTIREPTTMIESPLSGRRGVLLHASAELPEIDPTGETAQNIALVTRTMVPFELDTDTGVVLIDGTDADLELSLRPVVPRSLEREKAYVKAHGRGVEVAATASFRELVLTPGMQIAVHGLALVEEQDRGERGYRDAAPTRVRIVAHPDYPLAIGTPRRARR